ncbi:MAG: nuclear transport factor 2 family protein [Thermoleophilia bacterium]
MLRASFEDPVATITCREHLCQNGTESIAETDILATNVFVLEEAGWRLFHHHASWRGSTHPPHGGTVHNHGR